MKVTEKKIKDRLKAGERVLGTFNCIPSPTLINAVSLSGIDFVVIDMEHGPIDLVTAEDIIRAAETNGVGSVIRVPFNQDHLILRALDLGPQGVQVPQISTKEEAELTVRYAKYYPEGERGFSPFTRAGGYGLHAQNHAARTNENTLVVVHVEGETGVKNLKDIVSVKGIDVVFIGPYDLSQSLKIPGKVEDPRIIATIRDSVKLAKKHGLACGSYAKDLNYLNILIDCGVQYLTYLVDSALIQQSYQQVVRLVSEKSHGKTNLKK